MHPHGFPLLLLSVLAPQQALAVHAGAQHALLLALAARPRPGSGRRGQYVKANPRVWEEMVEEHAWRKGSTRFQRLFRMPLEQFEALVERIDAHHLRQCEADSDARRARGEPQKSKKGRPPAVSTSLALAMTLRYLAGGSYLDIMLWARVHSATTFYRHVRTTLVALDEVLPPLSLESDLENPSRLEALAAGFERRSYGKIRSCIGAVDGLLLPIEKPANVEGDGAARYFTRKGFFAWNVQAVCDADARFTHVSMLCVGSTHDSLAWSKDPLARRMALGGSVHTSLVIEGYHLVGDEAYSTAHTLSTPWTGRSAKGDAGRLAYNYYHSSARITIERAFGQLTRRWLILKRPYTGRLDATEHAPGLLRILRVCMKLHNRAVDTGTYRKLTLHPTDVTGRSDHPDLHPPRMNHRGVHEGVAGHTLMSSDNPWLTGDEAASAWFPPGHPDHDPRLWDPVFVAQAQAGHTLKHDCAPRRETTAWMAKKEIKRPTRVHWDM